MHPQASNMVENSFPGLSARIRLKQKKLSLSVALLQVKTVLATDAAQCRALPQAVVAGPVQSPVGSELEL